KSALRFDFPARGDMPPVKIFWYDAMKEQPDIPGVPKGEILGDLPRRRMGGPQQQGAQGQRPAQERPRQDPRVIGQVFNAKEFFEQQKADAAQAAQREQPGRAAKAQQPADGVPRREAQINRAAASGSNGSLFVGDKGFITTGTYGENTRLLPVERMKDYRSEEHRVGKECRSRWSPYH